MTLYQSNLNNNIIFTSIFNTFKLDVSKSREDALTLQDYLIYSIIRIKLEAFCYRRTASINLLLNHQVCFRHQLKSRSFNIQFTNAAISSMLKSVGADLRLSNTPAAHSRVSFKSDSITSRNLTISFPLAKYNS